MHTEFVLDALEQALHERQPQQSEQLIDHSDRGSQYASIRYTEQPLEAGVEPSVGSRGTGPPCNGCNDSITSDSSNPSHISPPAEAKVNKRPRLHT